MTSTIETGERAPQGVEPAERKWRWAALLIQVEALGALVLAAFQLLLSETPQHPMAVPFAILTATILFPLGSAVERGRHGAGLLLLVMYLLRVFHSLASPVAVLLKMPLLLIEGFVFGRALIAMAGTPPVPSGGSKAHDRWRIFLSIAAAYGLILYSAGSQSDLVGYAGLAAAIALAVVHEMPARIARCFRPIDPQQRTDRVMPRIRLKKPSQVVIDLSVGLITIAGSLYVWGWFASVAQQPGAMLVPSVLIIPLMALVYAAVGFMWIGVAVAERMRKPWVQKARMAAAIPLFLLLMLVGPMVKDLLVDVVKAAFRV